MVKGIFVDIAKILRFAWHLDGKIAGSARPGRYGNLSEELAFLREQGIRHVINLCETPLEVSDDYGNHLRFHHFPLLDGHAPSEHEMELIRLKVAEAVAQNEPCLIHCQGGVGRTATVIGVLLMELGNLDLEQSLHNLRQAGRLTQSMEQWNFLCSRAQRGQSHARP